jgi:hypothetical protein
MAESLRHGGQAEAGPGLGGGGRAENWKTMRAVSYILFPLLLPLSGSFLTFPTSLFQTKRQPIQARLSSPSYVAVLTQPDCNPRIRQKQVAGVRIKAQQLSAIHMDVHTSEPRMKSREWRENSVIYQVI